MLHSAALEHLFSAYVLPRAPSDSTPSSALRAPSPRTLYASVDLPQHAQHAHVQLAVPLPIVLGIFPAGSRVLPRPHLYEACAGGCTRRVHETTRKNQASAWTSLRSIHSLCQLADVSNVHSNDHRTWPSCHVFTGLRARIQTEMHRNTSLDSYDRHTRTARADHPPRSTGPRERASAWERDAPRGRSPRRPRTRPPSHPASP
jgi:hypothetical protein